MSFSDGLPALQTVIHNRKLSFGDWARLSINSLFLPKREPNYSLSSIAHLFMKRLHQKYDDVMQMDEDIRDELFNIEHEIIQKENEQANKGKPKGGL